MPRPLDRDLLEEMLDLSNLLCKFGSQLKTMGEERRNAVYRARAAGASIEIIRQVLVERLGVEDCATTVLMRRHFQGDCRCPKRR